MVTAVLSYHGWEIDPDRLIQDIRVLRERGWQDISLEDLEKKLSSPMGNGGRFFHVTSDDGEEQDSEFAAALRSISCPGVFFISLGRMTDSARRVYREILFAGGMTAQDHSLNHQRTFHYRHVVGFHSEVCPLFSSSAALGLKRGDPVCMHGGGLVHPRFEPSQEAISFCREKVATLREKEGSHSWDREMSRLLAESGLGFYQMGKLCIHGKYEKERGFQDRVKKEIEEGKRQLMEFTGKAPTAFAYPWWQKGKFAEKCLRDLGYRMTFSGQGMAKRGGPFDIPRIFINNETPRPLNLEKLAAEQEGGLFFPRLRALARKIIYR